MRHLSLPLLAIAWFAQSTANARADFAYAYAEQTVNALTITSTVLTGNQTGNSTSASATINGSGVSTNAPLDTLQAYLGAPPPAPQNDYTKYSTQGGGPQAGDFARGDAVITNPAGLFLPGGANTSNVAESYISSGGTGTGLFTSSGNWTLSGSFTTAASSVTVGYNYANDIIALVSGNGSASASFKLSISIKDQHGHEVDASPAELNTALSAPPNGAELITTGSSSATLSLAGLTAGDVYSISMSGTELTAVSLAVPEPSSLVLCGVASVMGLAVARIRRKRSAA